MTVNPLIHLDKQLRGQCLVDKDIPVSELGSMTVAVPFQIVKMLLFLLHLLHLLYLPKALMMTSQDTILSAKTLPIKTKSHQSPLSS